MERCTYRGMNKPCFKRFKSPERNLLYAVLIQAIIDMQNDDDSATEFLHSDTAKKIYKYCEDENNE